MRTIRYYDVVSMVIKTVESRLKEGIRFSEIKLKELETHCKILETFSDAFDVEEFSADYNEETEEVILSIAGKCFEFFWDKHQILSVIEKAAGLAVKCRGDDCVELSFRFGMF